MGGLAQRPLFCTLRCSKLTSVSFTHVGIFIFVASLYLYFLISCNKVNMAIVFKLANFVQINHDFYSLLQLANKQSRCPNFKLPWNMTITASK